MLRITAQKSSAQVRSYYEHSDYYAEGPSALKGYWFGKGAEQLGLVGEVDKQLFDRLAENRHPFEDISLTPRTREDRRVGWDMCFSASKSVSIYWMLTQDHRVLDFMRESVNETLAEMEKDMMTRVHVGSQMHTEKTGNLIAATWLHTTARPIDGIAMPGLHIHAWVANATYFKDRFKAMDISVAKKDAPYYEARFHSRLATKLHEQLGLPIERQGKKWFEIAGFSRPIVELYSERMKQIEEVAREKGIVNVEQKAALGAKTRESKSKLVPPEEQLRIWRKMLTDQQFQEIFVAMPAAADSPAKPVDAQTAIDHAIQHRFERQSTVRERELATDAIWQGVGSTTVAAIDQAFTTRDLIRDGKDEHAWVTTPEVLKEEQQLLQFARSGRGASESLACDQQITREWLSDEQKAAAKQLWQSTDRVMILSGKAGTGKSTISQEVVAGIEAHGHRVVMVAPTTKAVDVLNAEGLQSHTLASLLTNEDLQAEARDQVIWVDEAGLISSIEMAKLFKVAGSVNARIVLAGDSHQHNSISRGKSLELLEVEAGIKPITITQIRRQQDEHYRKAVEKLSRGNVQEGFEALQKLGAVKELPNETRDKTIATSYANSTEAGYSTLVIAPSRAEKEIVTQAIRAELRARGRIDGEETKLVILKPYHWTQAERQDAKLYSHGDIVEFHARGQGGFRPGERVEVIGVSDSNVIAKHHGKDVALPLQSAGAFSVYKPVEKFFSKGDIVKITQNRRAKPGQQRLTNGHRYVIKNVARNGELTLGNGIKIEANWGHIEHGVVTTSYSSQGDTKDKVIIAQSSRSFAASSPQQLYVSASRGRIKDGLEIYTDDLAGLRRAISQDRSVRSATELAERVAPLVQNEAVKSRIARLRHVASRTTDFVYDQFRKLREMLPSPTPMPSAIAR